MLTDEVCHDLIVSAYIAKSSRGTNTGQSRYGETTGRAGLEVRGQRSGVRGQGSEVRIDRLLGSA